MAKTMTTSAIDEIWVPILSFEGFYEISNLARVRSLPRSVRSGRGGYRRIHGRVMRLRKHRFGYPMVTLSADGAITHRTVHTLVAEAFIGPRPDGLYVLHRNGTAWDCRPENLYYGTQQQNMDDKVAHGTLIFGEKQWQAFRTAHDIRLMRERRAAGKKLREIATDFECTEAYVHQVVTGQKWKHASGPITSATKTPRRITDDELKEAISLRESGLSYGMIAKHLGVSFSQVKRRLGEVMSAGENERATRETTH